jgi:hypothetical protein
MTNTTKDILQGLLFLVVVFALLGVLIFFAERMSCDAKWSQYPHQYTFAGGCLVEIDGKQVPSSNVRIVK